MIMQHNPRPEPVPSNTATPAYTKPHMVVPIGKQHADDCGPQGECVVCGSIGEWNALVELANYAYGCPGYRLDE